MVIQTLQPALFCILAKIMNAVGLIYYILPQDGFNDIFQRDQPYPGPVFVVHYPQVVMISQHIGKNLLDACGIGNADYWPLELAHGFVSQAWHKSEPCYITLKCPTVEPAATATSQSVNAQFVALHHDRIACSIVAGIPGGLTPPRRPWQILARAERSARFKRLRIGCGAGTRLCRLALNWLKAFDVPALNI